MAILTRTLPSPPAIIRDECSTFVPRVGLLDYPPSALRFKRRGIETEYLQHQE